MVTVPQFIRKMSLLCLAISLAGSAYAAQCRFRGDAKRQVLTYAFAPLITHDRLVLRVTLRFEGDRTGVAELELPSRWAGQSELYRAISNPRAVSKGASITDTDRAAIKIVRYPPDQPVEVQYDLVQDWAGPLQHPVQHRQILDSRYFELRGGNMLVFPKLVKQVSTRFDWTELPSDWSLATSFATGERCQSYDGPRDALRDALFVGGDFRVHRFRIGNQPAVLAIRGQWNFTDDETVASLQKVISAIRAFWREKNVPYYLVTLSPFDTEKGSSNGTALTNGFSLHLSKKDALTANLSMFAHETLHEWNPRRMGEPQGVKWFTEGFTVYYADLLLYRAGLISLSTRLERVNADLRRYPNSSDLYVRGHVLALWLDGEIRAASRDAASLDNVLRELVRPADNIPLTRDRILQSAGRYLPEDKRRLLEQLVEGSLDVTLASDRFGPCVEMVMEEVTKFDVGFDLPASQAARRVTGLDRGSQAYTAGLREGQELTGWSAYMNEPDKLARFNIQTESGPQSIEYYPRGKRMKVPQYRIKQSAHTADPRGCKLQ